MAGPNLYLKRHTEILVKTVGFAAACEATGKSKATLGRYFSDAPEHADRFMPVDTVAVLEEAAGYPHVTSALAELSGARVEHDPARPNQPERNMNDHVIALSQRFALLMAEYHQSIEDGVISVNEAKRMLSETLALQQVLIDIKMKLEAEATG
ncbi:hypothetical protein [Ovoidimarina sediminis]|uniref:hypothetical protein n=1 Tax=Ovoidimarina sediminis TaxID=3079856 RepID=UPI00290CAB8F|nr:hypothetical protein [Rhodophyticola sp. MJ-SS7]MDU8943002.1 hypothetical protein [Rhodophyticola sp. MJ-SS7]